MRQLLKHTGLLFTESWHSRGAWHLNSLSGSQCRVLNELNYAMLTGKGHHTPTHNSQQRSKLHGYAKLTTSSNKPMYCGFTQDDLCIFSQE